MLDELSKLFGIPKYDLDKICESLKLDKTVLEQLNNVYQDASIDEVTSAGKRLKERFLKKQPKENIDIELLKEKIVEELVSRTQIWTYDSKSNCTDLIVPDKRLVPKVSGKEVNKLDTSIRPQLTGYLMKVDINGQSGACLLESYSRYLTEKDPRVSKHYYNMFRQGLDLLDLDPIVYTILNQNKNSMGYWLPEIVDSVDEEGFFKVPKTKIIKVPMPLLQLTRLEYSSLNKTTLDIVNEYCKRVFDLDINKKYFVKTGTYCSKFDFRNALVQGESEVNTLGEYLLFVHSQALESAHFDVENEKNRRPIIYGKSTTNEWVVRDFIEDKEDNLTIYHGLPLHTEYRVFVDFDTKEVLGVHSYWDKDLLEKTFSDRVKKGNELLESYSNMLNEEMNRYIDCVNNDIKLLGIEKLKKKKEYQIEEIRLIISKISELVIKQIEKKPKSRNTNKLQNILAFGENTLHNINTIFTIKQDVVDCTHDLLTYRANFETLNNRYLANKDKVCKHIEEMIQNVNLTGQWSIDIMQNKDDFYLIDMQGAEHSTYYKEVVEEEKRKKDEEEWIPKEFFDKGKLKQIEEDNLGIYYMHPAYIEVNEKQDKDIEFHKIIEFIDKYLSQELHLEDYEITFINYRKTELVFVVDINGEKITLLVKQPNLDYGLVKQEYDNLNNLSQKDDKVIQPLDYYTDGEYELYTTSYIYQARCIASQDKWGIYIPEPEYRFEEFTEEQEKNICISMIAKLVSTYDEKNKQGLINCKLGGGDFMLPKNFEQKDSSLEETLNEIILISARDKINISLEDYLNLIRKEFSIRTIDNKDTIINIRGRVPIKIEYIEEGIKLGLQLLDNKNKIYTKK